MEGCIDARRAIAYTATMMNAIAAEKMIEYKRSAWLREKKREQAANDRRLAAERVAHHAAVLLKHQFGARRVILFGSLTQGDRFGLRSDIDLAAEGILPSDFWRAWCVLDAISAGFEINLVAIESASTSLHATLEQEGMEL